MICIALFHWSFPSLYQEPSGEEVREYFNQHFPMNIHWEIPFEEYPKQCIYIYVPHGLIVFYGQSLVHQKILPNSENTYLTTHWSHYYFVKSVPILSHFSKTFPVASASKHSCHQLLQQGKSIMITPGAAREVLATSSNPEEPCELWMRDRFGYLKLAQTYGIPVVPIVCPDETNVFEKYSLPFDKWFGHTLNLLFVLSKNMLPYFPKKTIPVFIGKPIMPDSFQNLEDMQEHIFHWIDTKFKETGRTCTFHPKKKKHSVKINEKKEKE